MEVILAGSGFEKIAKSGFYVLCPDARLFGERWIDGIWGGPKESAGTFMELWAVYKLLSHGRTMFGYMIYDVMRGIDYLMSRSEINRKRIGMTGDSLGGMLTWGTMPLDKRIRAGVPICSVCPLQMWIDRGLYNTPVTWMPKMLCYFDTQDILAACAPRPILIIAGRKDHSFPIEGAKECFEYAREKYGVDNGRIRIFVDDDAGHEVTSDMTNQMIGWFKHWL